MHRDRDLTDPIPLRRVSRSRPLTEHEVEAIYGRGYDSPPSHAPVARSYSNDVIELPVRRARWLPLVLVVVTAGAGLFAYAMLRDSTLLTKLGIGTPDVVAATPGPRAEREPIELAYTWVRIQAATAVPNVAATETELDRHRRSLPAPPPAAVMEAASPASEPRQ